MRGESGSVWPGARFGLTHFIGREAETADVVQLLRDSRLVTLVGAPGAGKTRLAAEAAPMAARSFRDGLRPVALATVADADDAAAEIAVALGVRDEGDSGLESSLVEALRTAEVLVLLDSCEHVVHRLDGLVGRILDQAPRVRVLATSRVPLGIPGERIRRVPPLSRTASIELFTDRAGLVTDLVLDETGQEYVDQICQNLDGLPLAIELAARQTRALSLRDLLARLGTELPELAIAGSPAPAQRTLAATIAWSCRLLSAEQNQLFERLSVFAAHRRVPPGPRPGEAAPVQPLRGHGLGAGRTIRVITDVRGPGNPNACTMTNTDATEYLFDTGSDLGRQHMDHLARMLDGHTFGVLDPVGVRPGQRCLDVGTGGGSVARWLADRVGPSGEVVAIDIDTTRLTGGEAINVQRHDINDGLSGPLAGPYDLIHARLMLMHLPRREEIFAELVDALAPGGWIVVGDVTGRRLSVLSAHDAQDVAVWEWIQHLSHDVVSPAGGIDVTLAHRINDAMEGAGLSDIYGIDVSQTVDGGSPGALLHATLNLQAQEHLLAAGAEPWQMERYRELTRDPEFRTWFYQFVCLRGRKASATSASAA